MQESVFSEAEQLIQSWLSTSEEKQLSPTSTTTAGSYPARLDHYRHLPVWSDTGVADTHLPKYHTPVTYGQFGHHHHISHSLPPPLPTRPHWPSSTTDYWTSYGNNQQSNSPTQPHHQYYHTNSVHRSLKNSKTVNSDSRNWSSSKMGKFGVVGSCDDDRHWSAMKDEEEEEQSVASIMDSLMKKPIAPLADVLDEGGGGGERNGRRYQDPRVTMDMRHKQVKERRKARDEKKRRDKQRRQELREAWREAERVVREGDKMEGQRKKKEERMMAQQMETIRRQVQEETERKRRDRLVGVATNKPHPSTDKEPTKRDAVMVTAEELVKREDKEKRRREREEERERRRRENRIELVKQLEEVELLEKKEKSKILRRVISEWYDVVSERRMKTRRAVAWWAWHLMERVWLVWRRYEREKRDRRERDRMAREIQREKRLVVMAVKHYHYCLLNKCIGVWLVEVGRERRRREREREEARQRDRVQAFLSAAAANNSTPVRERQSEEVGGGGDHVTEVDGSHEPQDEENCELKKEKVSQPIIWRKARTRLDKLLSSVAPPTTNEEVESPERDHTHKAHIKHKLTDVKRKNKEEEKKEDGSKDCKPITVTEPPAILPACPRSRPVTKPIPMSGMEARSEALAERKRRREEREKERQREREEKEKKEEEEKKEREQREKEAAVARRREERRLAKQREMEKIERQRRERELTAIAQSHYANHLMRSRGLVPWLQFMEEMRRKRKRACQFHDNWRLRCVIGRWRKEVWMREREREDTADQLHHRLIKLRVCHHWRDYMRECKRLEVLSKEWSRELLTRKTFRGWQRVTATARREGWEKERRAKIHYHRVLKRKMARRWKDYVPLVREEREREVRRAGLRRKVSQWLPDYQPLHFHQDL